MNTALIWIIIGIILIISEILATSVVAVFIGIGAIVTGLLLHAGVIESLAAQLSIFSIVSVGSLVIARRRFRDWFGGFSKRQGDDHSTFRNDLGEQVVVESDFVDGHGRVTLNGVSWQADSADELRAGENAWIVANRGIQLTVSRQRPHDISLKQGIKHE